MERALVIFFGLLLGPGLLLSSWSMPAHGQSTAYVSDELEIAVRRGKTFQHRILLFLDSGDRVTVLEDDGEGYTRIRTEGGTEGWVQTRNLSEQPHARERVAALRAQTASLEEQRDALAEQVRSLEADKARESERADTLSARVVELEEELEALRDIAAEPLEKARQNEALREQLAGEQERVGALLEENRRLRDDDRKDWFLYGAGVSIGCLILGILLTRVRFRRRTSGWID
ncbi:TIGR04211 family SH3 domain-containing protein [Ectothiorhodospira marina]|uniref:SH3 domain protein n=1 Tax=Ectothiorhodospira marina TaxID=1396821 RepID=A0A1H7HKG8_9GAMM|nr:TIGR04211 family SH3 domain-containing protein [Ectothiorhodospira marina]SEK50903.1 SH3 domain protein [Ectothiorhodospira marina]